MKKIIFILILGICLSGCARTTGLRKVATFEGATLYTTANGKIDVLEMRGPWREMGRQYGALLGKKLKDFKKIAEAELLNWGGTIEELTKESERDYKGYPPRFQEMLQGISETSGLGIQEVAVVNSAIGAIFESFADTMQAKGCSGIAAWDGYTKDGSLVFGRNWDLYRPIIGKYVPYLAITIYNPPEPENSVANVQFISEIVVETAMNDKGIFLELNSGAASDHTTRPDRLDAGFQLFDFLLDCSTIEAIDKKFAMSPDSGSFIIQVADKNEAYSYEWPTYGVKKRVGEFPGLLVATNNFVDPSWKLPALPKGEKSDYTNERRANLLVLAEKYKGSIDPKRMRHIIGTYLDDGGAMFKKHTIYQVVVLPGEKIIWLRIPEYSGWEKIKLDMLFD